MRTSRPCLAAFGHHKCASMWVHNICAQAAAETGLRFDAVYRPDMFDNDLRSFVKRGRIDFIGYGNADFDHVRALLSEPIRAFHYVRDPRDIVVSAYFSHRNSHSTDQARWLISYREKLRSCSKEEGIHLELENRRAQFVQMRSWKELAQTDAVQTYRMEDMVANSYSVFLDLFGFLGLLDDQHYSPAKRISFVLSKCARKVEYWSGQRIRIPIAPEALSAERILGIVWEQQFSRLSGGRRVGEENRNSHYRKGVHGDWLNHFTLEHLRLFKEEYGDLLIQYGYESDADWDKKYMPVIEQRQTSREAIRL